MRRAVASRHELVAGVMDGHEVDRAGRVHLELLPQRQDVRVDRACRGIRVVAPDVAEQLVARQHALRMLREILEQLELLRCERDRTLAAPYLHFWKVDGDIAEIELFDGGA